MELKEIIKVMQHFEDGGEVEFSDDNFKTVMGKANKEDDGGLCWNWDEFSYRIKEQKQKVIIEKWLCQVSNNDYVIVESSAINKHKAYKKVKLIESYEVEL